MRFVSALTERTEALMAGTPDQQMRAQRERQAAEHAPAVISTREELRRTELEFGPRWITHTPTGDYFWIFGGDPSFAPNVAHYFVARDGTPGRPTITRRARAQTGPEGAAAPGARRRGKAAACGDESRGAVTKWLYQARVVPMGKPVLFPDQHGRPTTFTFDKVNFSQSRRNGWATKSSGFQEPTSPSGAGPWDGF